jgi:hypothetical protein
MALHRHRVGEIDEMDCHRAGVFPHPDIEETRSVNPHRYLFGRCYAPITSSCCATRSFGITRKRQSLRLNGLRPNREEASAPSGVHANNARLLVADRSVPFELSGSVLTVTVPSILDHEVVAIER